jgi:hypothetical protein
MREWLKDVGQVLTGAGLFIGILIYGLTTWRESLKHERELRGLLVLISAEISYHQRISQRFVQEPHRIIDAPSESFKTKVWDANSLRIAQFVTAEDVQVMAGYYGQIELIKEEIRLVELRSERIEEVRQYIEASIQQGEYVKDRIRALIHSTPTVEVIGK